MEPLFDPQVLTSAVEAAWQWVLGNVLLPSTGVQSIIVLICLAAARLVSPRLGGRIEAWSRKDGIARPLRAGLQALAGNSLPIVWLLLQWVAVIVANAAGWPSHLMTIVASLLNAWVIISLTSGIIRDPTWRRAIAIVAWSVAALNIVGLLDDTIATLDALAVSIGGLRISALGLLKGVLSLAVLLWAASVASRVFERRISTVATLTPSVQVLFAKLLKVVLFTVAIVAALSSVGIDLTAFAVFSGAVGVGIGFGLQKVVSNLISGVILLLDKSIKPGDVITVGGDAYGWINSLGARYASVVTRDGTEFLIPNEDLITQQVVNWSYSNNQVRLKMPIGISYGADVRLAIALCLEAAAEVERVIAEPRPACLLRGFGDNAVDLELRIWIEDPQNGTANVRSEVLLLVWDKFHQHGIDIPYPQRDLHIRQPAEITVTMAKPDPAGRSRSKRAVAAG